MRLRHLALAALFPLLLCAASVPHVHAQYMFLDTDGDGAYTAADVVSPSGPTPVDVWLVTDADKAGGPVDCPTGDGPLSISFYAFVLHAQNGTVSYGSFSNRLSNVSLPVATTSSSSDFAALSGIGASAPPGPYRLASLTVTVVTGTPAVSIEPETALSGEYFTGFGTECGGPNFDYVEQLGTDWSDTDGLAYGGVANLVPALEPMSAMTVEAGRTGDQQVVATDGDGEALTFTKESGPVYMEVTTTDPGAGTATGNVHLAPGLDDVGSATGGIAVTDGVASAHGTFGITVVPVNQLTLGAVEDVTVEAYGVATQGVTAADPGALALTYSVTSGPEFVTLRPADARAAILWVEPGLADAGAYDATIAVTNGTFTDSKTIRVTVTSPPPCGSGLCVGQRAFTAGGPSGGDYHLDLDSGDVNGDGIQDLVMGEGLAGGVVMLPGLGNGVFGPPIHSGGGAGFVYYLGVADFNGDGRSDVVFTAYRNPTYHLTVLLGQPDGGFLPSGASFGGDGFTGRPLVADFNRDSHPDVAIQLEDRGLAAIFLGNGDGMFHRVADVPLPPYCYGLAAGDVTGDGRPDLVAGGDSLAVYPGQGDGSFGPRIGPRLDLPGVSPMVDDWNGDGRLDVAVLCSCTSTPVRVFLGHGDGTFDPPIYRNLFPGTARVRSGDLTGDGIPDLAILGYPSLEEVWVTLLVGRGDGTFGSEQHLTFGTESFVGGLALADWNGDGLLDVAANEAVQNGPVRVYLNRGYTPVPDHAPVIPAPASAEAREWILMQFDVSPSDPDGDNVTDMTVSVTPTPPGSSTYQPVLYKVGYHEVAAATARWQPYVGAAGDYVLRFAATALGLTGTAETAVHVAPGNHYPVADAGGPYFGTVGVPVQFDGRGSSDPDGDALAYSWYFGDSGVLGVGAAPVHTYRATGKFQVALTVRDNGTPTLSGSEATTATIAEVFEARAFLIGPSRAIPLVSTQHPETCLRVEPVEASYRNEAVDLGSVTMRRTDQLGGTVISAVSGKTTTDGDRDGNGVEEISACFRLEDLRALFADVSGRSDVGVLIRGDLTTGGYFEAPATLTVVGTGAPLTATVMPNPFNPEGTLVFRTQRAGPVTVRLYSLSGRLVRRLWEEGSVGPGYHEVRVDGRDDSGRPLPSGVYYYSVESPGGRSTGRVTLLK